MKKSKLKMQKSDEFLSLLLKKKREEVQTKQRLPRSLKLPRNDKFLNAIRQASDIAIIGELKFASPSAGVLGSPDELEIKLKEYEKAGVDAISVITERHFFKGNTEYVKKVKKLTNLPVLQKDFVIDESQIYEAKMLGPDALLLIARIISAQQLNLFVDMCFAQGIEPIVEVFDSKDLQKACSTNTRIIAVNARDLNTLTVDIQKACRLIQDIPVGYLKLGFSGIHGEKEVALYRKAHTDGILIGTALIKEVNVDAFLSSLRTKKR